MKKLIGLGLLASAAAFALTVAPAKAGDVKALAAECAACHGVDGASTEADVPVIGGVSAAYLSSALTDFKNKARPCPATEIKSGAKKGTKTDMCQVAGALGEADIAAAADNFAGKPFVKAKQTTDAALAAKGKEIFAANCEKCHSAGGSFADDDAGILSGQPVNYLKETFDEYFAGTRQIQTKMKPMLMKVDKADLPAVINYLGAGK